jgi:hypothetical protein
VTIKKESATLYHCAWPEQKEIPTEADGWVSVRAEGFSILAVRSHRDAAGFITKYFKVLPIKTGKKKSGRNTQRKKGKKK